ncbi:MAG: hypothetical protein RSA50_00140 [Mucinivorans sp.]
MKKISLILLLIFLATSQLSVAQNLAKITERIDSLHPHHIQTELGFSFFMKSKDGKPFSDLVLHASQNLAYVSALHGYRLNGAQYFERNNDGTIDQRCYALVDVAPFQYHMTDGMLKERKLYGHAMVLWENNSDRGLRWRYKVGAYIHPWGYSSKKFRFNFSLGVVGAWALWWVNNPTKIEAMTPQRREMANYINSQYAPYKGDYREFTDVKLSLNLELEWMPSKVFSLTLNSYVDQGLCSPFNDQIKERYPELRKMYPHLVADLRLNFTVHKSLDLFINLNNDYERGALTIWGADWQSTSTIGIAWKFRDKGEY